MLKKFILGVLAVFAACGAYGGEVLKIADFENGLGLFSGTIEVDMAGAYEGKGCAKISNADKRWVIAAVAPDGLEQDLVAFGFVVKSSDAASLAVRFTDSTGQNFQQRLPLKSNGEWQKIRITDFSSGRSWGGADDKKWHAPVKKIEFILEQKATVWIDDVRAELTGVVLPEFRARRKLLSKATAYPIGGFEKGNDGFGGEIKIGKDSPKEGTAFMRLSKPEGVRWVNTAKNLSGLKQDFLEVTFWVRSKDVQMIGVRFKDSTGQDFQQRLPVNSNGEWDKITITDFSKGRAWGGANDKKWHAPAKSITFILEQDGTIDVDDIQARLNPEKVSADLDWQSTTAPNIFASGAEVRIPVETIGDTVEYIITDLNQQEVAKGKAEVKNNMAVITHVSENGYYLLKVSAKKNGQSLGDKYTSYAVIPPYEVKSRNAAPWGAMTHFAQGMEPQKLMPILKRLGITAIRDEHYWAQVEGKRGEYSFPAYSSPYMERAKKDGVDTLIAMSFANPNYDNGLTPHTDEACDAYGAYGQQIIKKFGSQIKWLEVWNEYNGTWCKGPAASDRSKSYAKLLKHAYQKIKAENPEVKVLGAACVLIPIPYIEGIFRNGGMDYMDGVVIHPYRGRPEGVDREVEELRELIRKYNNGKDKEIWVTETGLMDKSEYEWEAGKKMYEKGRRNIARYLPRQYILLLKAGCEKIFWYLASDHREFVSMGLVRNEDEPSGMGSYAVAPAAVSYATLIRMLDGKAFVGREGVSKYTRAHCYHFRDSSGNSIRTVWATAPAKMDFYSSAALTVTSLDGASHTYNPENGKVRLNLDEAVKYVGGKIDKVEEVDTGIHYLASSADDYSKTQGGNNWQYGYREGVTGEFMPMTQVETMWGVDWATEKIKYLKQNSSSGHPAGGGAKPVFVDRRWSSNYSGDVTLKISVQAADRRGDGIEFIVQAPSGELLRKVVKVGKDNKGESFSITASVKEGEYLDFLFGPGGNSNYDAFSFDIQIIQQTNK